MTATITALLAALVVGTPGTTFVERYPYQHEELQLHSWHEFWLPHPIPRKVDPPGEHYYFGKGYLEGHCHLVSEIGIKCYWQKARV